MPKNIWENHFGIRVNKKKCPISRCGSDMKKSLYCDQKNHKQSGTWEIKREYPNSLNPQGIMIDQYQKEPRPVCCNCNEKSSTKKVSKDQPSPIHNKFNKKLTNKKPKSIHKEVNKHHSSSEPNHNKTLEKNHHTSQKNHNKKEQPIQKYEYIVPQSQNNSQFNNQVNYSQQNNNSNFNNNPNNNSNSNFNNNPNNNYNNNTNNGR